VVGLLFIRQLKPVRSHARAIQPAKRSTSSEAASITRLSRVLLTLSLRYGQFATSTTHSDRSSSLILLPSLGLFLKQVDLDLMGTETTRLLTELLLIEAVQEGLAAAERYHGRS